MAKEQVKHEIGQFFDHFRKMSGHFRVRLTPASHSPPSHELLAGKMACCALLDALSVARFPREKSSRKRFCRFIREFSNYDHWDNVSIPQLLYGLQPSTKADDERLKKHAEACLARRLEYAIEEDPPSSELISSFPGNEKEIKDCSHLSLFYHYRCALIHEMRAPGYGYEFEHDVNPCYRTQTEIPTGRFTFQLAYPLAFFFNVSDECITSLEQHFLTESRSPFDSYEFRFGDVWRRPS
jgi:hypothetical protein